MAELDLQLGLVAGKRLGSENGLRLLNLGRNMSVRSSITHHVNRVL
jgi:hypothetical protein